jgi:hypothetical protein
VLVATAKKMTKKKSPAKAKAKAKAKPKAKAKGTDVDRAFAKLGKTKPKQLTPAQLAALALKGDVEALVLAIQPLTDDDVAVEMYKWLEVAASHGPTAKHRKAAEALSSDLLEASSLRYDDDSIATGGAHFELGVAYLTGADGLPRDLTRAAEQLAMAKERYYPWSLQGAEKLLTKTRKPLAADARAVFDRIYDGTKPAPAEDSDDDY